MHNIRVRQAVAAAVIASLPLITTMSAELAPAPFELPPPTGKASIGTTTWWLSDSARRETLDGSGAPRSVEVHAWYPSSSGGGKRAPYLREGLAEVRTFAKMFRAPDDVWDVLENVQTHADLDAAPAAPVPRFPVLLFSHGYTGIPSAYTALLEDLASHGYAVLSVVHPYEATAATLANGRVVSLLDDKGAPVAGVQEVFGEWGPEDETAAAVTKTDDDAEKIRLLRGYLKGLDKTHAALQRWVDDTKLVLDRLPALAPQTAGGRLAARLDMSRIGVFGHSMGGVTAGQFCVDDRRCRAGLNLDGIPQYGTMIDKPTGRPFLMVYSARPGRLGASDDIYRRSARPYYRIDVRDTRHLDFSDMAFWGGPLRERPGPLGSIAPSRVDEITRAIVREYFDQELLGRRSPLLSGTPRFPEVSARTVAPPAR
jgi:predicted dienelactone hydrolase